MCVCRHPVGEVLVQRALSGGDAGQGARVLPEAAQILRAERAETQTTQSKEEKVRNFLFTIDFCYANDMVSLVVPYNFSKSSLEARPFRSDVNVATAEKYQFR